MIEDLRLPVNRRDTTGSAETRRLRRAGRVPVNVYGQGQESRSMSACRDVVEQLVATRSSVVDMEHDGVVTKAVVQELQWDIFSTHIQHIDLKLVDPDARATVEVSVEMKGEPAALKQGGVLKQHLRTIRINCPDYRIPRSLVARIGALGMGETVKASDIVIPETARLETPGDDVVVELIDPRKSGVLASE